MKRLRSRGTIDFSGKLQLSDAMEKIIAEECEETGQPTVVHEGPWSDPVLVNRIEGEQSALFSRVDSIAVLVPHHPSSPSQSIPEIKFEDLSRANVSTQSRLKPIRRKESDLKEAVFIGEGVLLWPSVERNTDRYGFISLSTEPIPESDHVSIDVNGLLGSEGALICQILQTREAGLADYFRGFVSNPPEVGEFIELGSGTLVKGAEELIGLRPDDEREIDWLNPDALYQCHLQTVRLWFLPTSNTGAGTDGRSS
jgi:hypothetical protein